MKDKERERKYDLSEGKMTGFFDQDTTFSGDLSFKGSFRIDGNFKGKIDSDSMLIIGDTGTVEAEVKIGYLIINGEFKGNIQAADKVEIHEHGRVTGTINSPKLQVEEGAYLEVTCHTSGRPASPMPEFKDKDKDKE
jgi:cytoskeletal protein CcmA (bactofilin family)